MGKRTRETMRKRRHTRVRKKITGTPAAPRLNIHRSLHQIYAQVIDDSARQTLVAVSTLESEMEPELKDKSKIEQAQAAGKVIAERAIEKGIRTVVFDRGGYRYHGRVRAFAEAARKAGLEF